MSEEPYESGIVKKDVFVKKRTITGEIVALTDLTLDSRGLQLIAPRSRALLKNEIHELIITDEMSASPGETVNNVIVVGFFEIKTGGIVVVGDTVTIGKIVIGEIAGFDVTHMPNHMNIVVKAEKRIRPEAVIGDEVTVTRPA